MDMADRIQFVYNTLTKEHHSARVHLHHRTPFELLIATVLAAQCTDEKVNQVTEVLFAKYPSVKSLAKAYIEDVESIVKPTGFYKNKSQNIIDIAKMLLRFHKGDVPRKMDAMLKLPGVGRKTANVVLASCFYKPAIIVDTHVKRVTNRIGLTKEKEPEKIEQDLQAKIDKNKWSRFSYVINEHGRQICRAKKPECGQCKISRACDFFAQRAE